MFHSTVAPFCNYKSLNYDAFSHSHLGLSINCIKRRIYEPELMNRIYQIYHYFQMKSKTYGISNIPPAQEPEIWKWFYVYSKRVRVINDSTEMWKRTAFATAESDYLEHKKLRLRQQQVARHCVFRSPVRQFVTRPLFVRFRLTQDHRRSQDFLWRCALSSWPKISWPFLVIILYTLSPTTFWSHLRRCTSPNSALFSPHSNKNA